MNYKLLNKRITSLASDNAALVLPMILPSKMFSSSTIFLLFCRLCSINPTFRRILSLLYSKVLIAARKRSKGRDRVGEGKEASCPPSLADPALWVAPKRRGVSIGQHLVHTPDVVRQPSGHRRGDQGFSFVRLIFDQPSAQLMIRPTKVVRCSLPATFRLREGSHDELRVGTARSDWRDALASFRSAR